MTPERLFILVASLLLMAALIRSINLIIYLIRLFTYLQINSNVNPDYFESTVPRLDRTDTYFLTITWGLFYLFHHLIRYLN
jgi:hypothetical protein